MWICMRGIKRRTEPTATASSPAKVHKSRSWSPTWPVPEKNFRQTGGPAGANTYPVQGLPNIPENPLRSARREPLWSDILGMCDACKCQNPDRMLRVQQDRFHLPFPAVQGMPPQSAAAPNGLAYLCRGVKFFSRFCHNLFPAALGAALWVVIVFTLPRILTPTPQSR